VRIDGSVIYALDPAHVIDMHITWQSRFEDNVPPPARALPFGRPSPNTGSRRS
jgi:hypothetical protein